MKFRHRSPNDKSISMGGLGDVVSYVKPQNSCPPAGTVISSYNVLDNRSWFFDIYSGGNTSGEVAVSQDFFNNVADGNCGTASVFQYSIPLLNAGQVVASNFDGNTDRWRVIWDGGTLVFQDYTMYPTYGSYLGQSTGVQSIYISQTDTYVPGGDTTVNNYSDGYGGSYGIVVWINWYAQGTTLTVISSSPSTSMDYENGVYYDNGYVNEVRAIANGSGNYQVDSFILGSYYPQGTYVRTISDTPNYTSWYSYQFPTGTSERVYRTWDGFGGFQTQSPITVGSCYVDGTFIGSNYYDNNGTGPYDLYWNGYCSINSYYQGGSGCDSYGMSYGLTCAYTEGYDANSQWWSGYWNRVEQIADGSCGTIDLYVGTNIDGCYYPYGWLHTYNYYPSSSSYEVLDSSSNIIAGGSFDYSWSGDSYFADGYGGQIYYSWSGQLNYGDLIATGSFYDYNLSQTVYYDVVSDGSSGYFVNYYY